MNISSSLVTIDTIAVFLMMAGFVIGLGAVTVIDIHGLLGRTSQYWTRATVRTHKITKPMIWAGIFLVTMGGIMLYRDPTAWRFQWIPITHAVIAVILTLNGLFLSFRVSPFLLKREAQGRDDEILPQVWQRKIAVSLIFSDLGWWSALFLFAVYQTL